MRGVEHGQRSGPVHLMRELMIGGGDRREEHVPRNAGANWNSLATDLNHGAPRWILIGLRSLSLFGL